jgi:hypothetical protein
MRVCGLLEAVNVKPLLVVIERVTAGAERQVSTKLMNFIVAVVLAKPRWKHDLVRPFAISCRRRQFAFAPHVQTAGRMLLRRKVEPEQQKQKTQGIQTTNNRKGPEVAADGDWDLVVTTPLGERRGVLSLNIEGTKLRGRQMDDENIVEIFDGAVDGDTLSWKISITDPMPLTLEFKGSIAGDQLSVLGHFGKSPFSGTRRT